MGPPAAYHSKPPGPVLELLFPTQPFREDPASTFILQRRKCNPTDFKDLAQDHTAGTRK